jgi:hypothetical protein
VTTSVATPRPRLGRGPGQAEDLLSVGCLGKELAVSEASPERVHPACLGEVEDDSSSVALAKEKARSRVEGPKDRSIEDGRLVLRSPSESGARDGGSVATQALPCPTCSRRRAIALQHAGAKPETAMATALGSLMRSPGLGQPLEVRVWLAALLRGGESTCGLRVQAVRHARILLSGVASRTACQSSGTPRSMRPMRDSDCHRPAIRHRSGCHDERTQVKA